MFEFFVFLFRFFGLFNFRTPVYFIRDPELYKQIAVKDFESFEDHQFIVGGEGDTMIGNAVFLMKGKRWRHMRATLSPAFTGAKMRHMFELIRECTIDSCNFYRNKFQEANKNDNKLIIEITDFYSRYANDVIASCAFGLKINSLIDRNNRFYRTGQCLKRLSSATTFAKILIIRCIPWLAKLLGIEIVDASVRNTFSELVIQNIEQRERKKIFRPDLIDLLMKARKGNAMENEKIHKMWTDQEIVSQCFVFFLAGFDTSTWFAVATTYELACHPAVQSKLIAEIDEIVEKLGDDLITYDTLKNMKYLDMVVSEVMRMWSAATYVDRICTQDFTIVDAQSERSVKIEKGTELWIPIYSYHHDPKHYPDPDKFDPERFSDENKPNIKYYFPFGVGPRQCIGKRFALMEVKLIMFYMLKSFSFEVLPDTERPLRLRSTPFGIRPKHKVNLELRLRENKRT